MMKSVYKKLIPLLSVILTIFSFTACDDNTDTFGSVVMPSQDEVKVSQAVYKVFTNSAKVDSLLGNTSDCYLGRVTDPETGITTTCNFLTQFYAMSNYSLPEKSAMRQENGQVVADSVELRLYIESFYGDSLNSIKIGAYELSKNNILSENEKYYTNLDPTPFLSKEVDAVKKELSFAVADLSIPDSLRYSSSYNKNILIKLPKSFGTKILNTYYEHPEYFKDAYTFTRNVCPGFYFKFLSGNGTLVHVDVSTMSVFFTFTQEGKTYTGIQRVAATSEVIQNNEIENKNIDQLLNEQSYTFLKSPAGIFTEATLPIDEIFNGHLNDSVNSAKIVFKRQNNNMVSSYNFSTPSTILMVMKSRLNSFFENQSVPNNIQSFTASFDRSYNSYTFSNIANLVSYLKRYRDQEAGIKPTDNEIEKKSKASRWEANNPDWNKVVLVPVVTETNTTGTTINVQNDFSLTNTRLLGGANNPINISIVYSSFRK